MTLSLLILTGHSGSGKSTALHALEDHGYFCVDNIPPSLVESLIAIVSRETFGERIAVGIDVRERAFLEHAPDLIRRLRSSGVPVRLIYLEASQPTIIRRYSETRRSHPLDVGDGLVAAIESERQRMAPLRELADETIDTSICTPHVLRRTIIERLAHTDASTSLQIALTSFGFKHGLPLESDMVFDVRFLPNPYFEPALRPLSGLDAAVRSYVLRGSDAAAFVDHTVELLDFVIPRFQHEGKRYLTVGIGCTGGQHRSVAIAQNIFERLGARGLQVHVRHRDVKERAG